MKTIFIILLLIISLSNINAQVDEIQFYVNPITNDTISLCDLQKGIFAKGINSFNEDTIYGISLSLADTSSYNIVHPKYKHLYKLKNSDEYVIYYRPYIVGTKHILHDIQIYLELNNKDFNKPDIEESFINKYVKEDYNDYESIQLMCTYGRGEINKTWILDNNSTIQLLMDLDNFSIRFSTFESKVQLYNNIK